MMATQGLVLAVKNGHDTIVSMITQRYNLDSTTEPIPYLQEDAASPAGYREALRRHTRPRFVLKTLPSHALSDLMQRIPKRARTS